MKTVLIFAHECAPYHRPGSTIGAQRPAQFAKHLLKFGWRAIVICCDNKARRIAVKSDLRPIKEKVHQYLESTSEQDSLIIPIPSLKYDGWIDRLWYKNTKLDPRSGVFKEDQSLLRKLIRKPLTFLKFFMGDFSQSWQPCAKIAADVIDTKTKIDVCMGEHGPDAGLFLAKWFSKNYNVPWIADFRDPVIMQAPDIFKNIYKLIIRNLVRTANATIHVNETLKKHDSKILNLMAHCIPNGYDPEEFNTIRSNDKNQKKFKILHTGNLHTFQQIELIFEALALLKKTDYYILRFIEFSYYGYGYKKILNLAGQYHVAEAVNSNYTLEREKILKLMKYANLLLILSISKEKKIHKYYYNGVIPGKFFEYLGACKPILCIPGDDGYLDAIIKETNTGVIKKKPDEIADYLKYCVTLWREGKKIKYIPVIDEVKKYTRENQTRMLAKILNTTFIQ